MKNPYGFLVPVVLHQTCICMGTGAGWSSCTCTIPMCHPNGRPCTILPLCLPLCPHQHTPATCCVQHCRTAVPGQQHPHPPLHDCKHTCHVVPLPNMLTLTILAKTWHVLSPMACTHLAMLLPPPTLSQWLKSSHAPPSPSTLSHVYSTILQHE